VSAPNSPGGNAVALLFCAMLAVGFHAGILLSLSESLCVGHNLRGKRNDPEETEDTEEK
jgi:hypothetical protein